MDDVQRLQALARVEGKATGGLPVVLFLCVRRAADEAHRNEDRS